MPRSIDIPGVEFLAPISESYAEILTPEAVAFIVDLQRTFNARRKALLDARHQRQKRIDAGEKPDFLAETQDVRDASWTCLLYTSHGECERDLTRQTASRLFAPGPS